jgi:hypothetical protein
MQIVFLLQVFFVDVTGRKNVQYFLVPKVFAQVNRKKEERKGTVMKCFRSLPSCSGSPWIT